MNEFVCSFFARLAEWLSLSPLDRKQIERSRVLYYPLPGSSLVSATAQGLTHGVAVSAVRISLEVRREGGSWPLRL